MAERPHVGVAGCGSIGARYVRWLTALGARVTAYDTVTERRLVAAAEGAETVVDSLQAMLDAEPERILVATPPHRHADVAIAALEHDIDVLVEKPVVAQSFEAAPLVAAADASRANAWVVCNVRFHEGVAAVREHLPAIGRPLFARAHFGHRLSQMRPSGLGAYTATHETGGGVVLDCIHEFDYLRWLFGPIVEVDGCVATLGDELRDAEDYAEIHLRHASGVRVNLHLDFLMRRKRRGLEVHGCDGSVVWQSEGRQPEQCTVSFSDHDGTRLLHHNPHVRVEDAYLSMLHTFLNAPGSLQTLAEGVAVLEAALAARGVR